MSGMDAVEHLCNTHARLPKLIAADMAARAPKWVHAADLEPAAWEGLWQAARTWDPAKGSPFVPWARRRIRGAIIDEHHSYRPLGRVPRARARAVDDATAELWVKHRRRPTQAELAAATGYTLAELDRIELDRAAMHPPLDIAPFTGGLHAPTPDLEDEPPPEVPWVRAAVTALPDKFRHVIVRVHWRREQYPPIAADLGITESGVSRIHTNAAGMIRDAVAYHARGDPGTPLTGVRARRRAAYRQAVAEHHANPVTVTT